LKDKIKKKSQLGKGEKKLKSIELACQISD